MPDTNTVPVTIDVEPDIAAALDDPATRARLERVIRRTLRPTGVERLFAAIDALSDEARRRGLTDEILEAGLAAYNTECRDPPAAVMNHRQCPAPRPSAGITSRDAGSARRGS